VIEVSPSKPVADVNANVVGAGPVCPPKSGAGVGARTGGVSDRGASE
jgi:hypothetical protein